MNISRRTLLASMGAIRFTPSFFAQIDSSIVRKHDETVHNLLEKQIVDPDSHWRGSYPDRHGLHHAGSAASILEHGAAAYLHEQSSYYKKPKLFERMQLAANFLERTQNEQGNIDLLTTNFNSPPDTGFVVHHVATAANLAHLYDAPKLLAMMEPFLRKAGKGMAKGGIHTPNHRWVVSSALAQIHELFPDAAYLRRIEQWLAEGIDIDEDGQFLERSTTVYNAVTDRALVVMAHKLNRPDLLEPVRKNLDSMLYLLHPNYEVVTEISRRQDVNTRGTMSRYWFPLRYMAMHDKNGQYATLVRQLEPERIRLSLLMEYPTLQKKLPTAVPVPTQYEIEFKEAGVTRIRRDRTSAALIHCGNSRFFSFRRGDAVINAVRFATAFFGKGQFVPERMIQQDGVFRFHQSLTAGYYQPLHPPRTIEDRGDWSRARSERRVTEICHMNYTVSLKEHSNGFELRIEAKGTDNVPLAVEINLREGGNLEGVTPVPGSDESYVFSSDSAIFTLGNDGIRFGPGVQEHRYTQVRGAEPKLPGPSVYLTSYTPFETVLTFEWI